MAFAWRSRVNFNCGETVSHSCLCSLDRSVQSRGINSNFWRNPICQPYPQHNQRVRNLRLCLFFLQYACILHLFCDSLRIWRILVFVFAHVKTASLKNWLASSTSSKGQGQQPKRARWWVMLSFRRSREAVNVHKMRSVPAMLKLEYCGLQHMSKSRGCFILIVLPAVRMSDNVHDDLDCGHDFHSSCRCAHTVASCLWR